MGLLSFVLLITSALLVSISQGGNNPIKPEKYAKIIKQGFSTNYFKTDPPNKKYKDQNIQDVYSKGFRNLRLRARADLYDPPYTNDKFNTFLEKLEMVVDKCIETGVTPIISWINHHAEAIATNEDKQNYIDWWTLVAKRLKTKDYKLSFNLFTELGVDKCGDNCGQSLRENTTKYNDWTKDVVRAIRGTGGNNEKRIIILASPKKTAKGLAEIEPSIYRDDAYMMAEFHLYADGPNNILRSQKYWDGSSVGEQNVIDSIKPALEWTEKSMVPTYFGAWMAEDSKNMKLNEEEVISFAKFFVETLKKNSIPWSINVLDRYYDTKKCVWLGKQKIKGKTINFENVLSTITKYM